MKDEGDNERCVQWNPVCGWKDLCLQVVLNLALLDQQASVYPKML